MCYKTTKSNRYLTTFSALQFALLYPSIRYAFFTSLRLHFFVHPSPLIGENWCSFPFRSTILLRKQGGFSSVGSSSLQLVSFARPAQEGALHHYCFALPSSAEHSTLLYAAYRPSQEEASTTKAKQHGLLSYPKSERN